MNSFIGLSIVGLGALATLHFVYEAILLPSIRQNQRFKLFAVRDRLRKLKLEQRADLDERAFATLDGSLSWQLGNQSRFAFAMLAAVEQRIRRDPGFRRAVQARIEGLDRCGLVEFRAVRERANELGVQTLLFNSAMWICYLVPLVCSFGIASWVAGRIPRVTVLKEKELEQFAPSPI